MILEVPVRPFKLIMLRCSHTSIYFPKNSSNRDSIISKIHKCTKNIYKEEGHDRDALRTSSISVLPFEAKCAGRRSSYETSAQFAKAATNVESGKLSL